MSKACFIIIFIALWVVSGFISIVFTYAWDIRGEEYNANYLNGEMKYIILFSLGGCITVILTIAASISVWLEKREPKSRPFTKFVYWLGNIGVKKRWCDDK